MKYTAFEFKENKFLIQFVKKIYLLSSDGPEEVYGCIPNGQLGISIIVSGEGYSKIGAEWHLQPRAVVYGLVKQVQFHKMSSDFCELNINFEPHIFQRFVRSRLQDAMNNSIELSELFPKANVLKLIENLNRESSELQILESITSFLMPFLKVRTPDHRIDLVHKLIGHNEIGRVDELSSLLNISSTSIRTLFKEKMGIPPKDLIQIHRIRKSLEYKFSGEQSLTNLAYSLNYFDQAHFIHDFKDAVGLTPKQYFQNEKLTFDFYNFGRWRLDSFAPDFVP
jgi:AraC-like DNA-binding protein